MFRNLEQAWADLERGMRGAKAGTIALDAIMEGYKEVFYLGAYSSLMMSNCIARFTEDEAEAVAQLADLKKECTDYFGDADPLVMQIDEPPEVDPKDQFQ